MRWSCLLLIFLFSGCALFTKGVSTSLGDSRGNDVVVITSAKERAITYMSVERDPNRGGRIAPKRIVCAEPSPDVATAVSDAIQATLKAHVTKPGAGEAGLEAGYGRAFSESIAQLGSRLATIQLLRDELSDLCRAYANGAVSSITYTLRLSRLDKKMITLLIGEASAGTLSRELVSVSGSALAGGGVASKEKLDKADQRVKDATEAVSAANKDLKTAVEDRNGQTDPEKIKTADTNVATAEATVHSRLAELNDRMLEKWALETHGSGLLAATNAGAIAALPTHPQPPSSIDLGAIHRSFLKNDDLGTLIDACLTSLEENQELKSSEGVSTLNMDILSKMKEITTLEANSKSAEREYVEEFKKTEDRNVGKRTILQNNLEQANVKLQNAKLENEDLLRRVDELKGGSGGSGLAGFCRANGLRNIIEIMDRKIQQKFAMEATIKLVEFCKAAIAIGNEKIAMECLGEVSSFKAGRRF